MKHVLIFAAGLATGGLVFFLVLHGMAGGLVVQETVSPFGPEETAGRLAAAARAADWTVVEERRPAPAESAATTVRLLTLDQPEQAGRIAGDEPSRRAAVLLPFRVAVYTRADGRTYVSAPNAALLGRWLGGAAGDVLGGPAAEVQRKMFEALSR
jgi:hypothetical protein